MPGGNSSSTLASIIQSLRFRLDQQLGMTLLLGSQAGGLIRNPTFFAQLEQFLTPDRQYLTTIARFGECYRLLARPDGMSPAEIETFLLQSLKTVSTDEADLALAHLIRRGLFDTVVTTNVDVLLPQALTQIGLRAGFDYTLLNLASEAQRVLSSAYTMSLLTRSDIQRPLILQVFGDLTARNHIIPDRYRYISDHQPVADLLREVLRRDCLVIGLDPVWDEEIARLIPELGNHLFFINAAPLDLLSPLYRKTLVRNTRSITGPEGDYTTFVTTICTALNNQGGVATQQNILTSSAVPPSPSQHPSPISSSSQHPATNAEVIAQKQSKPIDLFISYASEDESLLTELIAHLAVLQHENKIRAWYNHKVEPGQVRQEEIEQHLNAAQLILLLVSASFLASSYIDSVEMKRALERRATGEAHVIPIILRSSDWLNSPLGSLEPLPANDLPVTLWQDRDSAFLDITNGIRRAIALLS